MPKQITQFTENATQRNMENKVSLLFCIIV